MQAHQVDAHLQFGSSAGIPPAGLGNLTVTDGGIGSPVCTSPATVFTATASLCNAIANGWTWTTENQVQFLSTPTTGTTSTVTFRLLSATGGGPAKITVSNNNQTAELNYDVSAFPACRRQQQLAKPIDNNPILPSSDKSESDKIAISDDPNSDLKTENTEGVTISSSKNNTSIKKAIYPNPANDVLNVDNIEGVQSIQIMDLNGKLIQTVSIEENEISRTLNVSNLSNGMYILKKVKPDGQLEAAKFQVIH